MSADTTPLDTLLLRWRNLPHGDRQAILRHLPPEHQAELGLALARAGVEHRSAQGRYAAYSPWLADILASCGAETSLTDRAAPALKPAVRAALGEAHEKAEEALRQGKPPSLVDLIRSALAGRGLVP